jgi:hypothetical protein
MSDRSWFYAAQGRQQGPHTEAELRGLIATGTVSADTLVWTEGMANWQRAGDIPGLMTGAGGSPSFSPSGMPSGVEDAGYGQALSADLPVWGFLGRNLLYILGVLLIIPAPWAATAFYRWFASRIRVPGRGNLSFTGQVGDIWWVFVLMGVLGYIGLYDSRAQLIENVVSAVLTWILVRWVVGNLASGGEKLPTSFDGSIWAFIGWHILLLISFISIIGWAWVATAWIRWICRNVNGTRRELQFNASGLEMLWRTLAVLIGCLFVIPIPWVVRWYTQWNISQLVLVPRTNA